MRPLLVMAELNAKSAGRAVVLESAETGLGPSEFLVGDAHWVRTLLSSVGRDYLLLTGSHIA